MISFIQFRRLVFAFVVTLPAIAIAQPAPDATFVEVQGRLKPGDIAEVVDNSGQMIRGRVSGLSPSTLVLTGASGPRRFDAAEVATIKRVGQVWDGAVKGAVVAVIPFALLGINCSDCGLVPAAIKAAGIGAVIGLGIDSLFGPKTVYRSASTRRRMSFAPILEKHRQGLNAAIAF